MCMTSCPRRRRTDDQRVAVETKEEKVVEKKRANEWKRKQKMRQKEPN